MRFGRVEDLEVVRKCLELREDTKSQVWCQLILLLLDIDILVGEELRVEVEGDRVCLRTYTDPSILAVVYTLAESKRLCDIVKLIRRVTGLDLREVVIYEEDEEKVRAAV